MPVISRLIRNVPGPELRDYFTGFGMTFPDPVNWDGGSGEIIEPVLKAVDTLTEIERERIRLDCDRIDRMTTEVGQTAIVVADEAQQDHLRAKGPPCPGVVAVQDRSRFPQGRGRRLFENARKGRTWDAFVAPTNLTVGRSGDRRNALAAEVRRFFREGEKVKIEVFDRTRPDVDGGVKSLVQVTVYREGLPDSVEVFKEQDIIGPLVYRPVYELGFTYEAASGVIEVVGDRKADRRDLAKVFAKSPLGKSC